MPEPEPEWEQGEPTTEQILALVRDLLRIRAEIDARLAVFEAIVRPELEAAGPGAADTMPTAH